MSEPSMYKIGDKVVITGTVTAKKLPVPTCIATVSLEAYKTSNGKVFHYCNPDHWNTQDVWDYGLVPATLDQMEFWDGIPISVERESDWKDLLAQDEETWDSVLEEEWDDIL